MDQIAEWRISHHIFFMRIYAPMSRNIAWQKLTSFIRWNHKTLCSCNLAQWTLFQFIYFPLMDYYSQKQWCFQCQSRIRRAFLNKPSTHGFWWILHDFWFYIVKNAWTSALLGSIPLFPTSFWTPKRGASHGHFPQDSAGAVGPEQRPGLRSGQNRHGRKSGGALLLARPGDEISIEIPSGY